MGELLFRLFHIFERLFSLVIEYFVLRARIDTLGEEYKKAADRSEADKKKFADEAAAKSSSEVVADYLAHSNDSPKSNGDNGSGA